ncbi:hypothetical protein AM506_19635 [Rossellomorea vietnamensis]|uniref:Uncharacterized protein n=1 Tax=Rossellomorea vietnamensis TaxID=218284 RepID=A0A0P6VY20_9BACI|nr:hypothetical protein AM506_19635 [Rossellomorea vietnamensis]
MTKQWQHWIWIMFKNINSLLIKARSTDSPPTACLKRFFVLQMSAGTLNTFSTQVERHTQGEDPRW